MKERVYLINEDSQYAVEYLKNIDNKNIYIFNNDNLNELYFTILDMREQGYDILAII